MAKKKVLLIGWDAADWKIISPMMDQGLMPALKSLVDRGVMGNLATLDPPLSPLLWTSIATGKTADKHGVLSFYEPAEKADALVPVSGKSRKVKALWNILHHMEYRCNVVGWWPSHPVDPIRGCMVSDMFHKVHPLNHRLTPFTREMIQPERIAAELSGWRVSPLELTEAHLLPFVPNAADIDQTRDQRLTTIAKIIAEATNIHMAATWLMEHTEWDFTAVYYDAIDHFGHGFMKFHPPQRPGIPDYDYRLFSHVIEAAYRFHDMMLARLLELAGENCCVFLISDHGFHSDHQRPGFIPKIGPGPAYEHSPFGIFLAAGPGIRKDERVYGAGLLDIAPSILAYLGIPAGQDMDGKVLMDIFDNPVEVQTIPSWEKEEGDFGMPDDSGTHDPFAAAAAMQQLIDLGYVEPTEGDYKESVEKAINERNYNMARVLMYKRQFADASLILEQCHRLRPEDFRFPLDLIRCSLETGDTPAARKYNDILSALDLAFVPKNGLTEARCLLIEGKKLKALRLLRSLNGEYPEDHRIKTALGDLYLDIHRYEQAEAIFAGLTEIFPQQAGLWLALGRARLGQAKFTEAVDELLNSVGLLYHYAPTHYHLGVALFHAGYLKESITAFETALKIKPGMARAARWLIRLYGDSELCNPPRVQELQESFPLLCKKKFRIISSLVGLRYQDLKTFLYDAFGEKLTDPAKTSDLLDENICPDAASGLILLPPAALMEWPLTIDCRVLMIHDCPETNSPEDAHDTDRLRIKRLIRIRSHLLNMPHVDYDEILMTDDKSDLMEKLKKILE